MVELLRRWQRHLRAKKLSPNTISAYCSDVSDFASWMRRRRGKFAPSVVCAEAVQRYLKQLRKGCGSGQTPAKPSTVNRRIDSLRSFFRWAHRRRLIDRNPAQQAEYIASAKNDFPWLTEDETHKLLQSLERRASLRDRALIVLILRSGLRVSEVAAIRAEHLEIDPEQQRGAARVQRRGRNTRTVPLDRKAVSCLLDYFEQRTGARTEVPQPPFLSRHNNPLAARSIRRRVKRCGELAGLCGLTPHTLRHTFCRSLSLSGADPPEIARLAGHKSTVQAKKYAAPERKQ